MCPQAHLLPVHSSQSLRPSQDVVTQPSWGLGHSLWNSATRHYLTEAILSCSLISGHSPRRTHLTTGARSPASPGGWSQLIGAHCDRVSTSVEKRGLMRAPTRSLSLVRLVGVQGSAHKPYEHWPQLSQNSLWKAHPSAGQTKDITQNYLNYDNGYIFLSAYKGKENTQHPQ